MNAQLVEVGIMIFIIAAMSYVAFLIRKSGAANPVTTGKLQSDVGKLRNDVDGISDKLIALDKDMATASDLERVQDALNAERGKIENVLSAVARVDDEVGELGKTMATRNVVITSMSESLRVVSNDLKEYRKDVANKLGRIAELSERIGANRDAIDQVVAELPAFRENQVAMGREISTTAAEVKSTAKQVDRIYDIVTRKGME